jgi:transcriptional regulator with XRE-family HTH domain
MEVARRFGENLRRHRNAVDVSQEELAPRCSLHRTEIGLLERGERTPRIDTLIKTASGLGIRIDCALLDGITWTPANIEVGAFTIRSGSEEHTDLMESATAPRARQSESADVVISDPDSGE